MNRTLKHKEFDRIERLRHRATFIRNKLDSGYISLNSKKYHLAELSALNWAIPILEDHIMHKTIESLPPDVREKFGFEKVEQVE